MSLATTARRCRRLELWTTLQCAGGRRIGLWPHVLGAVASLTLGLDSSVTVRVPSDAEATQLAERYGVVRIWESDTAWDEWVIVQRADDDVAGEVTLTLGSPTVLLGRLDVVTEPSTPDGIRAPEIERVGQTPAALAQELVIEAAAARGAAWWSLGQVDPTGVIDLSVSWASPLQVLSTIAAQASAEVLCARRGTSAYTVSLVTRIGADAPVLDVRHRRNLLSHTQVADATQHATVLAGRGAVTDGVAGTIGRATWNISAVSGTVLQLSDPAGGAGPIAWDGQLDGLAVRLPGGTLVPIVASRVTGQRVECASAPAVSVGTLVEIREADGAQLLALRHPPAVAEWGPVYGVLDRSDLPTHRNLVPNPALRGWATPSAPPDGWTVIGTPGLQRLASGPYIVRGQYALRLTLDASGEGILTPWADIEPTPSAPLLTGVVQCWVETGQVRVELEAEHAGGAVRIYPLGGALATSSQQGTWIDLAVAGTDAVAAGITRARLRLLQHGSTATTVIVSSAQLTLAASATAPAFVDGDGARVLWQAINVELATRAVPPLQTTVGLVDLAPLDQERYALETSLRVGQTARVVYTPRGLSGTARVPAVTIDLLVPGQASITLSNRPQDLTGSLARRRVTPRRLPTPPPALLAGDVTASSVFTGAGALLLSVTAPLGSDSIRASVRTDRYPTAAEIDAATGTLRDDGDDVGTLSAAGPYAEGQLVYIGIRAYRQGVGTRVLQLTDVRDAADAAQGPSLEVRVAHAATESTIRYTALGLVTWRLNDGPETIAPASPFAVPRPAAGQLAATAALYCERNGQRVTEIVTVPAVDADTITPDLVLTQVASRADSEVYDVAASDPTGGRGGLLTRTLTLTGCTARGLTGPGPHTLAQGQQVTIDRPFVRANATAEWRAILAQGGSAVVQRTIAAQDLTGRGREVISNPQWDPARPSRALPYSFGAPLPSIALVADATAPNATGIVLEISVPSGTAVGALLGAYLQVTPAGAGAEYQADRYRASTLYLVRVRARIPVGQRFELATNGWAGGTVELLSDAAGTGDWATYLVRVRTGASLAGAQGEVFPAVSVQSGVAFSWRIAEVSLLDLDGAERLPPAQCVIEVDQAASSGDVIEAVVRAVPATADSVVRLAASSGAPLTGAATGVWVPSGSRWRWPKRAFRTGEGTAAYASRTPGYADGEATLVIPEQGRDTVALGLDVREVSTTPTQRVLRATPTDPIPQGTGSLLLSLAAAGTGAVAPGLPIPCTSGSPVDITVQRAAAGQPDGEIAAVLSGPGRTSATARIEVPARRLLIPGRVELVGIVQADAQLTVRFRAWYATGAQVTDAVAVALSDTQVLGQAAPVVVFRDVMWDGINGWFVSVVPRTPDATVSVAMILGEAPVGVNTARTVLTEAMPTYRVPTIEDPPFGSIVVTPNIGANQFELTYTLREDLAGATVVVYADARDGGDGRPDPPGFTPGEYGQITLPGNPTGRSLVAFSPTAKLYILRVRLEAQLGGRVVATQVSNNWPFYLDNSNT